MTDRIEKTVELKAPIERVWARSPIMSSSASGSA